MMRCNTAALLCWVKHMLPLPLPLMAQHMGQNDLPAFPIQPDPGHRFGWAGKARLFPTQPDPFPCDHERIGRTKLGKVPQR